MSAERFEFNRVTFALPTQAFKITAFISAEERLPAVTEFVLRLLHTCGRVSLPAFRDYFGFSEAEALSVIESLDRQGYVQLVDEWLSLSEEMLGRFEASPENCPWEPKLKKRTDFVSFDLLTFSAFRKNDFAFASDNLVKINPADDAVGKSVERAKKAYRESFEKIERELARSRGEVRERSYGVHSIDSVEARTPKFVPVNVSLAFDQNNVFSSRLPEDLEDSGNVELLVQLRERIANEVEKCSDAAVNGVDEFLDLFQLDFLRRYVTGGYLDVSRYAVDIRNGLAAPAGMRPMLGSPYLKSNREIILEAIYDARQGFKGAARHLSSLAWCAPDYALWGRGDDFRTAVEQFGKALKDGGAGDSLHVFDYAQERQENIVRSKYAGTGLNELHLLRPERLALAPWSASLELMLYPTQFAVALIHVPMEGCPGVRVPMGVISKLSKHLHFVHQLLQELGHGIRYAGRWAPKKGAQPARQPRSMFEACPFLHYSSYEPMGGALNPQSKK